MDRKSEYIKDAAQMDWETGHPYSSDDYRLFKKTCKDDGFDVGPKDWKYYWECYNMEKTIASERIEECECSGDCGGAVNTSDDAAAHAPEKVVNVVLGQKKVPLKDPDEKLTESLLDEIETELEDKEINQTPRPRHKPTPTGKDGKFTDYEAWHIEHETNNYKKEHEKRAEFIKQQRDFDDTYYTSYADPVAGGQFEGGSEDNFLKFVDNMNRGKNK